MQRLSNFYSAHCATSKNEKIISKCLQLSTFYLPYYAISISDLCKFFICTVIPFFQPFIQQLLRENKTCLCSSVAETCHRTSFLVVLTVVSFLSLAVNFRFSQGCFDISLRMDHISFLWNWQNIWKRAPRIMKNIEKLHSSFKSNVYSQRLLFKMMQPPSHLL